MAGDMTAWLANNPLGDNPSDAVALLALACVFALAICAAQLLPRSPVDRDDERTPGDW